MGGDVARATFDIPLSSVGFARLQSEICHPFNRHGEVTKCAESFPRYRKEGLQMRAFFVPGSGLAKWRFPVKLPSF